MLDGITRLEKRRLKVCNCIRVDVDFAQSMERSGEHGMVLGGNHCVGSCQKAREWRLLRRFWQSRRSCQDGHRARRILHVRYSVM
jgi:hypothetical protein